MEKHFCERILHYLAYKHEQIRSPINVNNNILPTVTVDVAIDNGWGYTHDLRADKNPYPHDRRADKDSYPHDRNVTDDCPLYGVETVYIDR